MTLPLVLGGMVYGPTFLDIFERFCVASLRSPANLEALRDNGARLELYTDRESSQRLVGILDGLLPYELYELPSSPTSHKDYLYETLAAVHYEGVKRAAANDCAYHMLMPDQMYSERYFPNLFRLAAHGDVLHNGLNVDISIEPCLYLASDGSSSVSAEELGDLAWRHLHQRMSAYLMNRAHVPASMPATHFHLWRARDRVMMFSPHCNPAYLTPETARRYPKPFGTLDTQIQWMVDNFVCPSIEDDMVFISIEHADCGALPYVGWSKFAANCWQEIGHQTYRVQYYRKPIMEAPAAVLEGMPTAEDVLSRQRVIADGIEEWAIVGEAA